MVSGKGSHQVATDGFSKRNGSCFRDAIVRQIETGDARESVEVVRDRNGTFITDHVVTHLFCFFGNDVRNEQMDGNLTVVIWDEWNNACFKALFHSSKSKIIETNTPRESSGTKFGPETSPSKHLTETIWDAVRGPI